MLCGYTGAGAEGITSGAPTDFNIREGFSASSTGARGCTRSPPDWIRTS